MIAFSTAAGELRKNTVLDLIISSYFGPIKSFFSTAQTEKKLVKQIGENI